MIMVVFLLLSIVLSFTLKIFILTTHGDHLDGCVGVVDGIEGSHNTFGHGFLHGTMYSAFWLIPVLVINGMFERRGPKNY